MQIEPESQATDDGCLIQLVKLASSQQEFLFVLVQVRGPLLHSVSCNLSVLSKEAKIKT